MATPEKLDLPNCIKRLAEKAPNLGFRKFNGLGSYAKPKFTGLPRCYLSSESRRI